MFCGGLALFWFIAEYEAKKCLQSPHLQFFPMQLHPLSSIFCFVSIISRIFQSPASAWLQSAKWEKAESSRSLCVSPRAPRSPRPRFSSLKEALQHLEALDLVHLPAPRTLGGLDLVQPRPLASPASSSSTNKPFKWTFQAHRRPRSNPPEKSPLAPRSPISSSPRKPSNT